MKIRTQDGGYMSDAIADGAVWSLESYFPEFNGSLMLEFKQHLRDDLRALTTDARSQAALGADNSQSWEALVVRFEDLAARLGHLSSYLGCLEAAHSDVEDYALERAHLSRLSADVEILDAVFLNAFKGAADDVFEQWLKQPALAGIDYYLRRMRWRARYSMDLQREALAADLNVDGISAWGRLYDQLTGKLTFTFIHPDDGLEQRRPISQLRGLISSENRALGRAAFEGGNRAWQSIEDTCAAALNAIAGSRLTLYRHRGIPHFLDWALFQAGITHETLQAMLGAINRHLELPRAILRAKAGFFGRTGIWFFEREAPLPHPQGAAAFKWPEAIEMVGAAFARSYPGLSSHFQDMLSRRWIESQARPNKRPGAFCTGSALTNEQRVYMTFTGPLNNLTTLAHEVGHAFHGHLLRDTRPLARRYPMTLAETASVFAEFLFMDGLLRGTDLDDAQKFRLLDAQLSDAAVMLLDITTRFEFEKAFYEERQAGEVPPSRLNTLMRATQRRVFGDALLEGGADPLFWASKLHFYITGTSFYNFPYTFGFLLTRTLVDLYQQQGPAFLDNYEHFLKLAGSAPVEEVVSRSLGLDITRADFWERSILGLQPLLDVYRLLAAQHA